MKRSSSGEIVLSSVEMAYQLGLDHQAACVVFLGIRGASSDVDKGRDFGINPGLADDCSCPGVAYEHRRPVLQRKDAACGGDVVRKRSQRVLHRSRIQASKLKTSNDFGPTGTVRICTMDQDDIAGTDRRLDLSLG